MKNKKIISCAIATLLSVYSINSNAIACFDPAVLSQTVSNNINDVVQWGEELGMMELQMELEQLLAVAQKDNDDNAYANMVVRNGKALEEIQNIDTIEKSIPDKDVCGTVTTSLLSDEIDCTAENDAKDKTSKSAEKHSNFGQKRGSHKVTNSKIADSIANICEVLTGPESPEGNPGSTLCTRSDLMFGANNSDVLTAEQTEAVDQSIDIITGALPSFKNSTDLPKDNSIRNKMMVNEMRSVAIKQVANASLHEVAKWYNSSGDGISPMYVLNKFSEERYGNDSFLLDVANTNTKGTNEENKKITMPSQVIRKMAAMDAFQVHMSVLQFKQSLRMEVLAATSLSLQHKPL